MTGSSERRKQWQSIVAVMRLGVGWVREGQGFNDRGKPMAVWMMHVDGCEGRLQVQALEKANCVPLHSPTVSNLLHGWCKNLGCGLAWNQELALMPN